MYRFRLLNSQLVLVEWVETISRGGLSVKYYWRTGVRQWKRLGWNECPRGFTVDRANSGEVGEKDEGGGQEIKTDFILFGPPFVSFLSPLSLGVALAPGIAMGCNCQSLDRGNTVS